MPKTKLTDSASIPAVVAELTLEEKLKLVGEYTACHTYAIPERDIPALCLMDGATGPNGVQAVLDYITDPAVLSQLTPEQAMRFSYASPEMVALNEADLDQAAARYAEDPAMAGLVRRMAAHRPGGRQYISFPSGVNLGAAFDPALADRVGEAAGHELRRSGADVCMGPNIDIARDPLGGRDYEMYGEDPTLICATADGFIRGLQRTGTAAVAKHFLANNQETTRNVKDTHLSERTLQELYARPFRYAVQHTGTKAVMSAYNAINGTFTSYNKALLTDLLREDWGFDGVVVSDWGAASHDKPDALAAGLDLITCGPSEMDEVRTAVQNGSLPESVLDRSVARLLQLILWVRDTQASAPLPQSDAADLDIARQAVAEGSVLLKNKGNLLPLGADQTVCFAGRRSRELIEYGTGSTAVPTARHSAPYPAYASLGRPTTWEELDGADVLVYTVAASSGENVDREDLKIEAEDRQRLPGMLRAAKAKGLRTVVILNVPGPVEMGDWEADADAILCIFFPGCTGGEAAAAMLAGQMAPGGRLPVSFPFRLQDTPSYPNFPGEYRDVYYGEGIFVGYRSYDKRELPVRYPFGYGLSYTTFTQQLLGERFTFDTAACDTLRVPVRVRNTGSRAGSQVIQLYLAENSPRLLRPVRELAGFAKVWLEPGEEQTVEVVISREALYCFDPQQHRLVLPVGGYTLWAGTSCADLFASAPLQVLGPNPYPLTGQSTIGELRRVPAAWQAVVDFTNGAFGQLSEETLAFMDQRTLDEVLRIGMIQVIPDAVKLDDLLQQLYDTLARF